MKECLLALETSCDETAASVVDLNGRVLSSEVVTQIEAHRVYGGVVPELASRNHIMHMRELCEQALESAGVKLGEVSAFAATSGPGLVSSLLIGSTMAKALALAEDKPYLAINHLEGHLLSPFMGYGGSDEDLGMAIPPHVALIVSGGHTMLLHVKAVGDYQLLGRTRDDAAGEAFDKVGKMLGLPYPGGPEIDKLAVGGDKKAFEFPRSMMEAGNLEFSFSGLKTAVLYHLPKIDLKDAQTLKDVCASFQEAVIEVLVEKALRAAKLCGVLLISVSGGVSCNRRLRERLVERGGQQSVEIKLTQPRYSTDNAAMIGFAAVHRWRAGLRSALETDVSPNLPLVS
ncbi:tRNA (adenosine(37)-N6)-threonylcarbamoyltransferase complex transferase subunit TsaD [Phragmitibacter flavus]|uniref:tRNA N6-adenosine threonylcarbamoyltransferase n=2 Tax=Phragmitibacter flavus TaxID=2576071 RepID=A0A5R8KCC9_9BACT|nr:tRNA (adenosine(37)-N6)-threonylcarbamoyltransferase complex transferase subunit TsaD [Phragmitibacter flavus]